MSAILPDRILTKMSAADRKKLGKAGVTASEGAAKCDHREEIAIHNQIKAFLHRNYIRYLYASPNKRSTLPVGYPDFTIFGSHFRVVFIEVKTAKGKLTKEQLDWQIHLITRGHFHYVVGSYLEAIDLIGKRSLYLCNR
jgi:hypothetical protein